jgi:sporulation-control protein spo0M
MKIYEVELEYRPKQGRYNQNMEHLKTIKILAENVIEAFEKIDNQFLEYEIVLIREIMEGVII